MKILIKLLLILLLIVIIWSCDNTTKIQTKSEKVNNDINEKIKVSKKIIETNFETLINKKNLKDSIKDFGIVIDKIDYNNYNVDIKENKIILTNELHETIQGKKIKITDSNIENLKAKIKIEFGFNQYTIDDSPAQPLEFTKQTKWLNLNVKDNSIEIPELYNNSSALKIFELLGFKNNSEIQKWIEKTDFATVKNLSIKEQRIIYSKILHEKEKYKKCCPEYIKQATMFVNTKVNIANGFNDLNIELITNRIIIEINGTNNGEKYKRVIIEM